MKRYWERLSEIAKPTISPPSKDNEFLQEKILGECWHEEKTKGYYECSKCGYLAPTAKLSDYLRDFSLPLDYCALEDRMSKLTAWVPLSMFLHDNHQIEFISEWGRMTRYRRAALIAEYWRSRDD